MNSLCCILSQTIILTAQVSTLCPLHCLNKLKVLTVKVVILGLAIIYFYILSTTFPVRYPFYPFLGSQFSLSPLFNSCYNPTRHRLNYRLLYSVRFLWPHLHTENWPFPRINSTLPIYVTLSSLPTHLSVKMFTARTLLVYLNLLIKLYINIPRTLLVSRY